MRQGDDVMVAGKPAGLAVAGLEAEGPCCWARAGSEVSRVVVCAVASTLSHA